MTSPGHDELREHDSHGRQGADRLDVVAGSAARGQTPEERLEALLAERRRELEKHARRFEETLSDVERREQLVGDARASVERVLRIGAADLEAREADVAELQRELELREEGLREEEARLARRRSDLGAVELKRAAVEQREQAVAAREAELGAWEEELAARDAAGMRQTGDQPEATSLVFVPGESYRLVEAEHQAVRRGDSLELDGEEYVVVRIGPSPLPDDDRRCAYLVRGPRRDSSSDGST
jgi:hypothetical protein